MLYLTQSHRGGRILFVTFGTFGACLLLGYLWLRLRQTRSNTEDFRTGCGHHESGSDPDDEALSVVSSTLWQVEEPVEFYGPDILAWLQGIPDVDPLLADHDEFPKRATFQVPSLEEYVIQVARVSSRPSRIAQFSGSGVATSGISELAFAPVVSSPKPEVEGQTSTNNNIAFCVNSELARACLRAYIRDITATPSLVLSIPGYHCRFGLGEARNADPETVRLVC